MQTKRILVVDDEPIVGYSIKISLQPAGYAIEVVTSAAEALHRYQAGKYDLILTDNIMPGMSGTGLADQIKRHNPDQPIILLTGSPPFELTRSFDRVVMKPFAVPDLRRAVAEVMQTLAPPKPAGQPPAATRKDEPSGQAGEPS